MLMSYQLGAISIDGSAGNEINTNHTIYTVPTSFMDLNSTIKVLNSSTDEATVSIALLPNGQETILEDNYIIKDKVISPLSYKNYDIVEMTAGDSIVVKSDIEYVEFFLIGNERALIIYVAGVSGYSGYSGFSGYSGTNGLSGIPGLSGLSGRSGWSGAKGDIGLTGADGISGSSGYSGWSGHNGTNGASGFSGQSGWSGINGQSGVSGWSGYSGYSGYSGQSGWSGASGQSGISGTNGLSVVGESGHSGYSGYSGYSGESGYSGISGDSGISGFSGYSGWSGYSGYSGYSGWSGISGDSGISGWSGQSGFSGTNYFEPVNVSTTQEISGVYILPLTSKVIRCNALDGPIMLSIPSAIGLAGKEYVIKKIDNSTNMVTLDPYDVNGITELLDTLSSVVLTGWGDSIWICSNGVSWDILSRYYGSGGGS